jgi:hypothetical protein
LQKQEQKNSNFENKNKNFQSFRTKTTIFNLQKQEQKISTSKNKNKNLQPLNFLNKQTNKFATHSQTKG